MPLVTNRESVLGVYEAAAEKGWVIPTFCSENLTSTEAVLTAVKDHSERIGCSNLPITLAITNLYPHRSQSTNYTHTRRWDIGMKLFLADIRALTEPGSPFEAIDVMIHLDHIQPDLDKELLGWDMAQFSSIMFDASGRPFDENIALTAQFVEKHGSEIVIEGACDETESCELTTPENAARYVTETGADFIVANLGTEHRASAAELKYHGELARRIKERIGAKIVLHGCSSVSNDQIGGLFEDGVCKVNIWTALERDSSPSLLGEMVKHSGKVAGSGVASRLLAEGYLGEKSHTAEKADLGYYTTLYRQGIVFKEMRRIVGEYLELWYR
ncbi:MAG: class II fructose-bisphosphate aldolase [Armatimonadota bacterium]